MEPMTFARGDGNTHYFGIDADSWSAGGRLFFAAKPAVDDDTSDSAAVIQNSWGDTDLDDDEVIDGVTYKMYNCYFPPSTTFNIKSDGADSAEYLGEFQYVPSGGDPQTFPVDGKIPVVVYFDIKRKTGV